MSDPQALRVRPTRKEDIEAIVRFSAKAFKGRPLSEALFPARLQTEPTKPGEAIGREEFEYRVERLKVKFDKEDLHYVVVVDDQDTPIGSAIWQSPPGPSLDTKPDESDKEKAEKSDKKKVEALLGPENIRPKGLDTEVVAWIESNINVLEGSLRDALGEEGYKSSWYLDALAVDPAHQRKGIGKMLMQWGLERAEKEHTNVRLMSSEAGAKLYRAVGFEEVGSLDVFGGMEYAFIKRAV